MAENEEVAPRNITQADDTHLGITWTDGKESVLNVKMLREKCPCANCIDEWSGAKKIKPGDIPESIRPINIKAVGLYAIQFDWNDGHSTGIYPYSLLRSLDGEEPMPNL